jgi:hypothetical protein
MTQLATPPVAREQQFDWPLCDQAEGLVLDQLDNFLGRNAFARRLRDRMRDETGTLLLDWVDYLVVSPIQEDQLRASGYTEDPLGDGPLPVLWHPEAMLPRVIANRQASSDFPSEVALRVESISDFMVAHGLTGELEGSVLTHFRRFLVSHENGTALRVIERRGYRGYVPDVSSHLRTALPLPNEEGRGEGKGASTQPEISRFASDASLKAQSLLQAHELWKTRRRIFPDDTAGFAHTLALLQRLVDLVGRDLACHVVFAEERDYWQRRNRAGQVQKARQDKLGLGWANHDHHTFRSSRRHFVDLMRALEILGFERRERYYAGAQAGWGAQILEQPVEGIVAFCDVDLRPEETAIDFSRQQLPESEKLGTIGLWVGLHGESFLEAGMHHLECRFDYALLREQLAALKVNTMNPFSDFPFLKQAFTEGERWPVRQERAQRLLDRRLISREQFQKFVAEGAIGSHLENLQRKGGFKGFNQKSVSVIIEATDPRKQPAH